MRLFSKESERKMQTDRERDRKIQTDSEREKTRRYLRSSGKARRGGREGASEHWLHPFRRSRANGRHSKQSCDCHPGRAQMPLPTAAHPPVTGGRSRRRPTVPRGYVRQSKVVGETLITERGRKGGKIRWRTRAAITINSGTPRLTPMREREGGERGEA